MGLRWSLFPSTFSRELPGHHANDEEEPAIAELMRKGPDAVMDGVVRQTPFVRGTRK
jgi:hypothetical protein